ncbi:MAG: sugar phosphate isomerase/epimerase [Caldilineaceae bacterium]
MTQIKLGVLAALEEGPEHALEKVHNLDFPTCQVGCWRRELLNDELAKRLRSAAMQNQVEITTFWAGLPGRHVWDFIEGPTTIGLAPEATRAERLAVLKQSADFAQQVGVASITTHVGFIPENPTDPRYPPLVAALKEIAVYCAERGLGFWFETGQETPITLLRTIQDIGTDNLGINLDPANLLMYGKANPVDALDIFRQYVRGVHAKDGEYPTNGHRLGVEKPLGQGRVNFPVLLGKLKALGFTGALTIEREISGPQQIADIQQGKRLLEDILQALA